MQFKEFQPAMPKRVLKTWDQLDIFRVKISAATRRVYNWDQATPGRREADQMKAATKAGSAQKVALVVTKHGLDN